MNTQTRQGKSSEVAPTQQQKPTTTPHVVIVGGGFGGLQVAKELGKQPVHITIIDRHNFHLFQPMLYQVATAGLSPSDISNPIRAILEKQDNTGTLMAEVTGIDLDEQQVLLGDRQAVHYDYLVLATGATSNYFGHPEWQQLAPGLKSINDALTVRRTVLSAFEAAEREPDEQKRRALLTFVLVGGGPTGVELAGAIAELAHQSLKCNFRHINPDMTRIILVQGPDRILPGFPASLAQQASRKLQRMGVEIKTGKHVKEVRKDGVMVGDEHLATENIIWTAGVKASPAGKWLHADVDHDGRVKVQPDLSVPGHNNIFVIGDTALVTQNGKHLPGLAPVAIQEGKYVASIIASRATGNTIRQSPFHYFDKGTLATVGRGFGIVDIGPIRFSGLLAWLTWLFVHIFFLIGLRSRILVFLEYAWIYITFQRGTRIILPENDIRQP
ncbi:NAD(P)/FAD-dependent oxidoreductase [Dictyobacter aurantiacus]|uniref:NADH:ubiquinone reductase (non-electrogenic) n=1 Tax=Dictyobacter aurantiacus TaxID=1936993 RepID=A0A401ZGL7_9CHLR|nr:NAD(P)/FAD-dependent oxidoreductase [Dictyobacter aurantiacus]GCE06030.1 NADH dehydrogenase [Dictyobacter aurantiacus]